MATTPTLPGQLPLWDPASYACAIRLPALPDAPQVARDFATKTLTKWQLDPEHIETVRLIISELVTNAARQTGRITGPPAPEPGETIPDIHVYVHHYLTTTTISAWDSDPTPPVLISSALDAEHGRGLQLVAMLAKEWRHRPRTDGKVIICRVEAR